MELGIDFARLTLRIWDKRGSLCISFLDECTVDHRKSVLLVSMWKDRILSFASSPFSLAEGEFRAC